MDKIQRPDQFRRAIFSDCAAFCYTVFMTWASKRRLLILLIIGAVVAAFLAIFFTSIFYKAPSCSDNIQNQNEVGIDCGGPCPYLCTSQELSPTVLFTKAISNNAGRTDVVASIENINATAGAKDVPYTLTLYGVGQVLIQEVTGTIDLPPSSSVPVFVPGISSGSQKVVGAFLSITPSAPKWVSMATDPRIVPVVSNTTLGGSASSPRIDAVLGNATVTELSSVRVIVIVKDDKGNVVGASQTVVPSVPAQGQATATFTWNNAFSGVPATIEVIPVIPLP
jgi:hypothetical protein